MLRILHCISDTNFGGAGRVLLNYLNHYDKNTFEIYVVIPQGSKLIDYMDPTAYQIIEFDGLYDRSFDCSDIKKLKKLIKKLKPDIVHSHGAFSARIAGKQCGCKVVYTRHSVFDLPRWQTHGIGKWLVGRINTYYADRIIAVSPAAKTLLIDSGTPDEIIEVVFNGVEAVEPIDKLTRMQACKRFDVNDDMFVCSIIARLEEIKGHRCIIDAARLLKDRGIKDVRILIAGAGGIENDLKEYAKQCDVTDIVIFVGFIKEIEKLLSVTDLQLNASYGTEATSMSLLEGFSLGIPAVVSDYGGNPFVVSEGVNGLIFSKKDAGALCRALLRMKEDKELYQRTRQGALQCFKEKFTAQKMTEGMEKIYIQLSEEAK